MTSAALSHHASGFPIWSAAPAGLEIHFVGRGPRTAAPALLRAIGGEGIELAWARQVHSATVLEARPGGCGDGDAMITRRRRLALAISTADCVPVVLAANEELAALHAGWRGIVAGVVPRTVARLSESPTAAWIGPAIGPCCYEVDAEVARRVVSASDAAIERPGARGRPHLDLPLAVERQLRAAGVDTVDRVGACTRCRPDLLWSYRRDGEAAGRNLLLAWRT